MAEKKQEKKVETHLSCLRRSYLSRRRTGIREN